MKYKKKKNSILPVWWSSSSSWTSPWWSSALWSSSSSSILTVTAMSDFSLVSFAWLESVVSLSNASKGSSACKISKILCKLMWESYAFVWMGWLDRNNSTTFYFPRSSTSKNRRELTLAMSFAPPHRMYLVDKSKKILKRNCDFTPPTNVVLC